MILTIATVGLVACPGCASPLLDSAYYDQPQSEAPVSEGMRLAAPGYGDDAAAAAPIVIDMTLAGSPAPEQQLAKAAPSKVVRLSPIPQQAGEGVVIDLALGGSEDPFDAIQWPSSPDVAAISSALKLRRLAHPADETQSFGAAFDFAASSDETGLAFDVGFSPRAAYRREGELEVRSVGAEFRFGQDFDQRGVFSKLDSWYVFAGADGEALVWEGGDRGIDFNPMDDMRLRDQLTVGDMQAGLALQLLGGEMSMSYIRREVRWAEPTGDSVNWSENFGGLSFTLRR